MLETVIIEPKERAQSAVIWLHGLGADGHDFEPIVPALKLPESLQTRFVFPHAPLRKLSITGGAEIRGWYDIPQNDLFNVNKQDSEGIKASSETVGELIQAQIDQGISSKKIVLAGFSQGGAIALYTGLCYPHALAGILALSTYMPIHEEAYVQRHAKNQDTPIMLAHGKDDHIIPFKFGLMTKEWLSKLGYKVNWHSYPMQHEVCQEEIDQMSCWLQNVL